MSFFWKKSLFLLDLKTNRTCLLHVIIHFVKAKCFNRTIFFFQESRYTLKKTITYTCSKHISITGKASRFQNYFKDFLFIRVWFFKNSTFNTRKNILFNQNTQPLSGRSHNYSSLFSSLEHPLISPFSINIDELSF